MAFSLIHTLIVKVKDYSKSFTCDILWYLSAGCMHCNVICITNIIIIVIQMRLEKVNSINFPVNINLTNGWLIHVYACLLFLIWIRMYWLISCNSLTSISVINNCMASFLSMHCPLHDASFSGYNSISVGRSTVFLCGIARFFFFTLPSRCFI